MSFFADTAHNPFLWTGLCAGALAGLACGTIGPYVVERRMVFLGGALAHVAVGGVGAAIFLRSLFPEMLAWLTPLHGAAATALLAAPLLAVLTHRGEHLDTAIGALWASGMALGILLLKLTPGYHAELMSYLFGNLSYVTWADVTLLGAVCLVAVTLVVLSHRRFLATCIDPEYARLMGVSPLKTDILLLVTVALAVIALTRVVGLILVIALLSLPAATASRFTRRLSGTVFVAAPLAVALTTVPRVAAYGTLASPEAAIVLAATLLWLVAIAVSHKRQSPARTEGDAP